VSLRDKVIAYLQTDRKNSVYIPELDETIYFRPITVMDMEKIITLSQGGTSATAHLGDHREGRARGWIEGIHGRG
jgi:hypothetical protein